MNIRKRAYLLFIAITLNKTNIGHLELHYFWHGLELDRIGLTWTCRSCPESDESPESCANAAAGARALACARRGPPLS